ncbi:MAG: methyl-accepting chemotaxis protein [Candidatus Tumulicola sp.]
MATATPRASQGNLHGAVGGGRLTLGTRILLSFGVLFVLMLVMAAISYTKLSTIDDEGSSMARDSVPGMYLALSLRSSVSDSYAALERAIFVDADADRAKRDIDQLADLQRQFDQFLAGYQASLSRADDRERFRAFKAVYEQYLPLFNDAARQAQVSRPAAQSAFARMTPVWDSVIQAANVLVEENRTQADDSVKQIRNSITSAEITLAVALSIVLLAALAVGYALFKAITALTALVGQAQKSSLQVTTSVSEIAATSKEQQATANETAATTTEIGATSREIFATSRDLLRTMNEVSAVAEQSATLAGAGQSGLTQMTETMRGVMEASGSVNAKLAILNEKASNINQVVATITKVADQTNLLSLNAAIEAEKAGEYGRGFSVVATEIRRLADQTAVATYDIAQTVKEIQSAVSAGVMGMDKFSEEVRRGMHDVQQVGSQLSQIITEVRTLAPRFQMVNEGMQTQATGAEQITQALSQLSEAAQQTAESLRQSSEAIDNLTLVANQLRTGVSRVKIEA